MENCVAAKKKQSWRNQKQFLEGSDPSQKEFCGHR
jgi:hypothetical protein